MALVAPVEMDEYPGDYAPVGGRKKGGILGAPGSAMNTSLSWGVIFALVALGTLAVYCTIASTMFFVHYDDISSIDDNDDRLDDIDKAADFKGSDIDFKKDVEVAGDVEVRDTLKASRFEICTDYLVCSDGVATEGTAVSLNEGCVTDGFDAHPAFVFDVQDNSIIDEKQLISLGSSNAILLYSDSFDSGLLTAKALRYSNGAYNPTVLSATVQGTTDSSTTWAGTSIDDGQTVFIVRNNGASDDDVVLVRCVSDGTTLTCDSGVAVYSDVGLRITELLWLGSSGVNHWFVVIGVTTAGSVETRAFVATTTADAAVVGVEAAAVVIDSDGAYFSSLTSNEVPPAHLVQLSGVNSAFTFGVVFGGVDGIGAVSAVVHTLGTTPSVATPTQTDISGAAHVLHTRDEEDDDEGEFWAGSLPGTNNIVITFTDRENEDASLLYSVNASPNLALTATTFVTPAGQGTILQAGLEQFLDGDAERYQIECLSSTYCVVAYRAVHNEVNEGKVAIVEFGSDGAISRIYDRAAYTLTHPTHVSLVAAGEHHFLLSFVENAPGSNQERGKLVRGSLPSSNSVSGEIHFGLSAKGQAPLGIADETCVGTSSCSICIAGMYTFDASSPLFALGHASRVYAYSDGSLGTSKDDPTDPFSPSIMMGTYVGNGAMIVRPAGLDEPL